jgi:hypothetical protein
MKANTILNHVATATIVVEVILLLIAIVVGVNIWIN